MGSCFATHIGAWMQGLKLPSLINPFGILYNPVSIGNNMQRMLDPYPYELQDLEQQSGLWHSFDHHGVFSHPDPAMAVQGMNGALQEAAGFARHTNRLILTPGSAYIYTFKKTGQVVANCHKFPASAFEKRRLGVGEVVAALATPIEQWKSVCPDLEIILSVSPVRHIRDGLVENQGSKATLVLALEEICRQFPFAHYFPAYELLLDDLRDYRFYESDMVHPNEQAIRYIREYFSNSFFSEATLALNQRIVKIINAANHRPLHPETPEHHRFRQQQLSAIAELEKEFSFLDFSDERAFFESFKG
ncbi:MAG: GSCFA domain-containing protein [Saprospiraceae bacterium]|nr:GSCFA domain-containing protein [Saprospiraceae bacterium]